MSDLTTQTLVKLCKNIKEKKVSSTEVTKAFIERSEKSKTLNAYITTDFENALTKAKQFDEKPNLDLKLPGIPIAVKDLFCTKNVKTTAGSKILQSFTPTYESTVTDNLWNAGGILLGKLNCDEFAMGSSNETSYYGNVQNPIDENLVPGGSSGGSASAVAAQLTPITIGTDRVDYYGSPTPLSQIGNISTLDPRTLTVQPWEKSLLDEITKAIINANLGLNPQNNGEVIIISVPVLTEERRKDLVKRARAEGENAKVSLRTQRKDANDMVKSLKDEGLSEDAVKNAELDVQNLTNSYSTKVDELVAVKEEDIMKV